MGLSVELARRLSEILNGDNATSRLAGPGSSAAAINEALRAGGDARRAEPSYFLASWAIAASLGAIAPRGLVGLAVVIGDSKFRTTESRSFDLFWFTATVLAESAAVGGRELHCCVDWF